jgi:hypothetical protein
MSASRWQELEPAARSTLLFVYEKPIQLGLVPAFHHSGGARLRVLLVVLLNFFWVLSEARRVKFQRHLNILRANRNL